MGETGYYRQAMKTTLAISIAATIVVASSNRASADAVDQHRPDCLWPAAGGAVGGIAIAWYGYAGIMALRGQSAYDLADTPANVALILGLETAGLIGGSIVACRIWGEEGRWYPTAGSVILGGVVGGTAAGLLAFWAIDQSGLDSNTDNPVRSALSLILATTAGTLGGGYAGYRLDRSLRGRPSLLPIIGRNTVGLAFHF